MKPPEDHAALLARTDFVVPPGVDLSPAERDLLVRFGRWMEALAAGRIAPVTPSQEQFVRAARGEQPPATDHERAWVKFARLRAEVANCFRGFARARAEAAALEATYSARRAAVLAAVREQLDAIDAEFAGRLQAAAEAVAGGEQAVRELVLRLGQGIHIAGVDARYYPGRVSVDAAAFDAYAEAHPEVRAFRKVGKPWVSLRFTDPAAPPPAARQLPAGQHVPRESEPEEPPGDDK